MLRLAKWLLYRDQVLDGINTLLVMYPRGRQFADDFPALRDTIRSHFDAGVTPVGSALQVSAAIIRHLFGQLEPAERDAVLERMQSVRLDDLEPIAARQISRRPEIPKDRVVFATRLLGGALLMARRMAAEGTLSRAEHAALLSELDQVLRSESVTDRLGSPSELFAPMS